MNNFAIRPTPPPPYTHHPNQGPTTPNYNHHPNQSYSQQQPQQQTQGQYGYGQITDDYNNIYDQKPTTPTGNLQSPPNYNQNNYGSQQQMASHHQNGSVPSTPPVAPA